MTEEARTERPWGERDAGSLRAQLRPVARTAREAIARVRAAYRLFGVGVPRGDVRLSFGFPRQPDPRTVTVGGLVKLFPLARAFPTTGRAFNVLYLVTSGLPDGAVALARAAKRKRIAVVINQNGVAYPGWYGRGFEQVNAPMADLLRLADHVFYQSEFCRVAADEFLRVQPGASEVLYNPVDTATFSPAAHPPSTLTLLLAGSQAKSYRVRTALDVLARVAKSVPDARLIVTGGLRWTDEDNARREVVDWARALGVEDRLTLRGAYVQSEAPDIYRAATLLLHTKYNDPCPTVVIEALACGLPVVYSATGGVPELVGDEAGVGVPGELRWDRDVPPEAGALADAVLRVNRERARFSAAARRRAVERFDVSQWVERHRHVFERAIA